MILLQYKKYLINRNGSNAIVESSTYKNQLAAYLSGCERDLYFESITYNISSLRKLFRSYYQCTQTESNFEKAEENIELEFNILTGMTATTARFYGNDAAFPIQINSTYNASYLPLAGASFDVVLPRNQRKSSVTNEVMVTAYNSEGHYKPPYGPNYTANDHSNVGAAFIKVNNLFRYSQPLNKVSIFLNAGVSNGFVLSKVNSLTKKSSNSTSVYSTSAYVPKDFRNWTVSLPVGVGISANRIKCEVRYETDSSLVDNINLALRPKRFYMLLSYQISQAFSGR